MKPARIFLIDRNGDTRGVLRLRLSLDGFWIAGESFGGPESVGTVAAEQPDVVVVDLNGPSIADLRRAAPNAIVVVFAWFADPLTLADALRQGADVVLDKSSGPAALSAHIRAFLDHPSREAVS